jgi:hypothetical protein
MEWLLALLTSLSADPKALELERPKAAAAVAFAYASLLDEPPAPPAPPKTQAAPCPSGNCPKGKAQ